MTEPIKSLFAEDVTRDIPPVVYFHEESPEKLQAEVSEYIVTGGWPEAHPNHKRVPQGIHEQYVRLLRGVLRELQQSGGPTLPTAWISGFYGSGKSSFAKLLGYALDGRQLPDGRALADVWLSRNTSPRAAELREIWQKLHDQVQPIAVVFDVGAVARDNEHLHAVMVRQIQRRLGYCTTEAHVARFELGLERNGEYDAFVEAYGRIIGRPWSEDRDRSLVEEDFSLVMHELYPQRYQDPMSWLEARLGTEVRPPSPEEAVTDIRDMLDQRAPDATLFVIVDEVSQYVLDHTDRTDKLRVFASALGAKLRGRAWMFALGQQKIEEGADASFLTWAKDRFPPHLRTHLATTNIRDVVHRRLLQKTPTAERELRALFQQHKDRLRLFAYGCEDITEHDFIETYPMLPEHIDLLLQITTQLRTRSSRAQGDDQAIRGLLQLLGELFRTQGLANAPLGALITLEQIYDVQYTALESDVQESMGRILAQCANDDSDLGIRVAKAVSLLELIQDTVPTTADLVARCLYARLDQGNQVEAVQEALEDLRRRNLLGYSEKDGYKIQSSAGEEWEKQRRDISVPRDRIIELIKEGLNWQVSLPNRPRFAGRTFPWMAWFNDGRTCNDERLVDPRDPANVAVDFRYLVQDDRSQARWVRRSAESILENRILWVCGNPTELEDACRNLERSRRMVERYRKLYASLNPARRLLLVHEENRQNDLKDHVRKLVSATFMNGAVYFRGRVIDPDSKGGSMATALETLGDELLPQLYPSHIKIQVSPGELQQIIVNTDLVGISPKFLPEGLGIFELDNGQYMPSCGGVVVKRVLSEIEQKPGLRGVDLLAAFGGPPYGYVPNVVKACVAGLLRGSRLTIQPEGGTELTAVRDSGTQDVFEKIKLFNRAAFFPAGEDPLGTRTRRKIQRFFKEYFQVAIEHDDQSLADAVETHFHPAVRRLHDVFDRLAKLPGPPEPPPALSDLQAAFEDTLRRLRNTLQTVVAVKRHLAALKAGMAQLDLYDAELTPEAINLVRTAHNILVYRAAQLHDLPEGHSDASAQAAEELAAVLATERPWQSIQGTLALQDTIKSRYTAVRGDLLAAQLEAADGVRAQVKSRVGFDRLKSDARNHVLQPIHLACTDTTPDSVAPPLLDLVDTFQVRLARAAEEANARLDELLSRIPWCGPGDGPPEQVVRRLDLKLKNRMIENDADLELLLTEIRERLEAQLAQNVRIRLV